MARIFGAVGAARDVDLESLLTEIYRGFPGSGKVDHRLERVFTAGVALGLTDGDQAYSGSIVSLDGGETLACCLGFMPGAPEFFEGKGLDPASGTAANIVSLYRSSGPSFLRELPGMFSLALFDGRVGRTLLATDRSGVFPVYFTRERDRVLFASSIVPLVKLAAHPRADRGALMEMFLFEALYGGVTCYEGIEVIPNGGYVVFGTGGGIERGRYFKYEDLFDPAEYSANRSTDAPAQLTAHMKNCLSRILDGVDAGATGLSCGGGIDCSYIGGMLNQMGVHLPIFCSNVAGMKVKEGEMARETAETLGSEFFLSTLTRDLFYPYLLRSIRDFGQPIVHPNTTRVYPLIDSLHQHGRRCQILGVASDLLFGGYGNVGSFYRYQKLRKIGRLLPEKLRRYLGVTVEDSNELNLRLRMRNKLSRVARLGMINFERASMQAAVEETLAPIRDSDERALKVLMLENLYDYQQHLLHRRSEETASNEVTYFYPFHDLEMLRFAVNLPPSACVGWKDSKILVRQAAIDALGPGIASRPKWGGDVPLVEWVTPMKIILNGGFLEEYFRFDPALTAISSTDDLRILWNMVDIELWGRMFLCGEKPAQIIELLRKNGIDCADF